MPPCDVPVKHVEERTAAARFPHRSAPRNRLHSIWLTSRNRLQLRTTYGPTSGIEVVPRSARRSAWSTVTASAPVLPPNLVTNSSAGSSCGSARTLSDWAALFAAHCRCRCRCGDGKPWRERPRCARPTWPRACPEGSLTPWLSLSLQVVGHSLFGAEKRRVFAASNALDCEADLPDDPVLFVRRMLAANCSRSRALPWPLAVQEMVVRAGCIRCRLAAVEVITSGATSTPSAITTTMLHLCSAPCKALRSAPPARTRGLRALTVPARR